MASSEVTPSIEFGTWTCRPSSLHSEEEFRGFVFARISESNEPSIASRRFMFSLLLFGHNAHAGMQAELLPAMALQRCVTRWLATDLLRHGKGGFYI